MQWVEDDDGAVFHAQRGRGINPIPLPALAAQLRVHLFRVIATLARHDNVHRSQIFDAVSIHEGRGVLADLQEEVRAAVKQKGARVRQVLCRARKR